MLIPNSGFMESPQPRKLDWAPEIKPGWIPIDIDGLRPIVRWINVGKANFAAPMFDESIARLRFDRAREIETELSALTSGTMHLPEAEPAGFIVHMTRCGSTLIASAIGLGESTVSLSEASPFDKMLNLASSPSKHWSSIGAEALTSVVKIFAHYRDGCPQNVVVKCATGGFATLAIVRRLWPGAPCLVLCRNPIEVLVSNLQKPAPWLSGWYYNPVSNPYGSPPDEVMRAGFAEFCAWVLGRFCTEALQMVNERCRVLDYRDLSPETVIKVAEYFGVTFADKSVTQVSELFRVDAKHPDRTFEKDALTKQNAASDRMHEAVRRWTLAPYAALREQAYQPWKVAHSC